MGRKLFTFERPDGVHIDVEVPDTVNDFPDTVAHAMAGQVLVHNPVIGPDGREAISRVVWDRVPDDWKLVGGDIDDELPDSVVTSGEAKAPEPEVDPNILLTEERRIDPNIGSGPLGFIAEKGSTAGGETEDALPEHMREGKGGWFYITAPDGEEVKVQTRAKALDTYRELYGEDD